MVVIWFFMERKNFTKTLPNRNLAEQARFRNLN